MKSHSNSILFFLASSLTLSAADPAKESTSYYKAPLSYSTTRDPDVPKYARHAPDTGFEFLNEADWLDIGMDYRMRFEYRDDDIRRPVAGLD